MNRVQRLLATAGGPRGLTLFRWLLLAVAVVGGALDAWFFRQWDINQDGTAYLDIARAFAAEGPAALVNGYWSPLYPALLGTMLKLFDPPAALVYPALRVVNFTVYLVAVFAFDRLTWRIVAARSVPWAAPAILVVAWAGFILLVERAISIHLVGPDIGVAAVVFWAASELVDLEAAPWPAWRWMRLGALLAIGYWWKAILFPVSGVALLIAAAIAFRRRDAWRGPVASGVAFALLALVLVIPVSRLTGRATFGETGRLNQLWFVNGVPHVMTLCLPPGGRLPLHSVQTAPIEPIQHEHPLTCRARYASPRATQPLWYDPSPWFRDVPAYFDIRETLTAFRRDIVYMRTWLAGAAPWSTVAVGLAALALLAAGVRLGPAWPLVALGVPPILFYLVVYVELRHVVPFLVCLAAFAAHALAGHPRRWARYALAGLALVAGAELAVIRLPFVYTQLAIMRREWRRDPRPEQLSVRVSHELSARGLKAGDRVVTVNTQWDYDWATRIGLKIFGYVPEYTYPLDRAFAELSEPCLRAVYTAGLAADGVRAVVLRDAEAFPSPAVFDPLGETGFRVLLIDRDAVPDARCRMGGPAPRLPVSPPSSGTGVPPNGRRPPAGLQ